MKICAAIFLAMLLLVIVVVNFLIVVKTRVRREVFLAKRWLQNRWYEMQFFIQTQRRDNKIPDDLSRLGAKKWLKRPRSRHARQTRK